MLSKSIVERARRENSETMSSSPSRKKFIISSNLGRLADLVERRIIFSLPEDSAISR